MRYRSGLLSSSFPDLPWVSYCLVIPDSELIDLMDLGENLQALRMDQEKSEFLILLPEKSGQIEDIRSKFSDVLSEKFLKIGLYSGDVPATRLKNLAFSLAKGIVVMNLVPGDCLAPRMTTYTYKEMMTVEEKALVYDKRGRQPQRLALLRGSFYEIGGFDESMKSEMQVSNCIDRLKNIGVKVEVKPHDHLTKSKTKRGRAFDFFRRKCVVNPSFQKPSESEYKWLV